MSTSKHIGWICVAAIVVALIICVVFLNADKLGIQSAERVMGYENRLFDTEQVHTIDIVMDDWDEFIENCEDEMYRVCSVVIDNEAITDVAIRAKGNTSLSTVSSMGSQRYSFKLEFDQYDDAKSYHGLDKLSLNNTIQDTTYMKDYLTYRMMADFGVEAPLCSFAYITVNGEDWGLYLAVEGVEDSFLQRSYGSQYGDLYKPDSMDFGGGGPGNGQDFDFDEFIKEQETEEEADSEDGEDAPEGAPAPEETSAAPERDEDSSVEDAASSEENDGENASDGNSGFPTPPDDFPGFPGGDGGFPFGGDGGFPFGGDGGGFPGGDGDFELPEDFEPPEGFPSPGDGGGFDFFGGFGGGGASLQYVDDDPASYSTIFNSAKTTVTEEDKERLVASLKKLSENEDIESAVDVDQVIRYFVVHNYVVNGDSYTGSIVHNYYLYEEDGKLSMIPWDYNLAFGTFQASNATDTVNDAIDTPMNVNTADGHPMWDWIQNNEEYKEQYHQYFQEFLNTVDMEAMVDETYELIAPYVEKDPTAFYTYEEFETGVDTLRTFLHLRNQSIQGQLDGTIPSTNEGQSENSDALIDASSVTISAMGAMGGGGFGSGSGGFPGFGGNDDGGGFPGVGGENASDDTGAPERDTGAPERDTDTDGQDAMKQAPDSGTESADSSAGPGAPPEDGQMPEGFGFPGFSGGEGFDPENAEFPDMGEFDPSSMPEGGFDFGSMPEGGFDPSSMPEGFSFPGGDNQTPPDNGGESGTTAEENPADSAEPPGAGENPADSAEKPAEIQQPEKPETGSEQRDSSESQRPERLGDMPSSGGDTRQSNYDTQTRVLLGVSAAVLLLGLIVAFAWRRKR